MLPSKLISKRRYHGCLVIENGEKVLVVGGYGEDIYSGRRLNSTEVFDVDTQVFSLGPTIPVAISDFVLVAALPNSEYAGYLVGGRISTGFPQNFSDIYGITRDLKTIQEVGHLQKGIWFHVGLSIPEKIQRQC